MHSGRGLTLWLADVEVFDPQGGRGPNPEKRWRCPVCRAPERAFCVNIESGLFNCKRGGCGVTGKLADYWEERPQTNRRERAREHLRRLCELPSLEDLVPSPEIGRKLSELGQQREVLLPLQDTVGSAYLQGRGLDLAACEESGVRFSRSWLGRPAVYFPLNDRVGDLVAAQGRYVDGRDDPKTRTIGDKKNGLFVAAGAWHVPAILLTEAPIDALSLATAGFPGVALCGTNGPTWLAKAMAFKRVLLAFDADEAGDRAAEALSPVLQSLGAHCQRLRPAGAKDWNEFLMVYGREELADCLALPVLSSTNF